MKKFKTQNPVTILDSRQKPIGDFIIYMKIDEVIFNESMVTTKGYYYYEKPFHYQTPTEGGEVENVESTEVIILSKFNTNFQWSQIAEVETILQPIDHTNLRSALEQRITEFAMIQMQIEDGQNFGTTYNDWILFE